MAFSKRTWKGRQGTGLNKFSIGGASPVTIINQPDSVTEQGDALSAGNLNDLEQRIYDAFEDEATALDQHEARIENLEQKAGDYSTVQYRGTNAVPTGKAKYGLVDKIVGKSRAWNQKAINGNFADVSTWQTYNCSYAVSGNVATVTATDSVCAVLQDFNLISGHVYFCSFSCKASNSTMQLRLSNSYGGDDVMASKNTNWQTLQSVWTCNTTVIGSMPRVYANDLTAGDTFQVKEFILRDLTLIFGAGNEPATVADALAQLPALGQYDAYDAGSLVDTTVEGVKTTSRNILDGSKLRQGDYNALSYLRVSMDVANRPWINAGTYTIRQKTANVLKLWLMTSDADNNLLETPVIGDSSKSATATFTNGGYLTVIFGFVGDGNITPADVIAQEVMVVRGSTDPSEFSAYADPLDTLSLSSPVTLRSAGAVSEVLTVQTGKKTRPIGSVDLGGDDGWDDQWEYNASENVFYRRLPANSIRGISAISANILCAKYEYEETSWVSHTDKTIGVQEGLQVVGLYNVVIKDTAYSDATTFKSAMSGVMLYYELETPLSDEQVCDPVIDNTIATEAGGTISTIQTQTPVIDNCLDAGYLTL